MKWLALAALSLTAIYGVVWYRRWLRAHYASSQWLRELDQRSSRIEFDGPAWRFPYRRYEG